MMADVTEGKKNLSLLGNRAGCLLMPKDQQQTHQQRPFSVGREEVMGVGGMDGCSSPVRCTDLLSSRKVIPSADLGTIHRPLFDFVF